MLAAANLRLLDVVWTEFSKNFPEAWGQPPGLGA